MFRDVSYEFVKKPQSWEQASETCKIQGGNLLKYLDCDIKDSFTKVFKEPEITSLGWWIGEGLMGSYDDCNIQGE